MNKPFVKWTPDYVERLVDLFEQGQSDQDISESFSALVGWRVSEAAIQYKRLQLGLRRRCQFSDGREAKRGWPRVPPAYKADAVLLQRIWDDQQAMRRAA